MRMKNLGMMALAGIMTFGLCACNSHENEEVTVGISNPIKEVTEEEMCQTTGIDLPVMEGMENVVFYTIDDSVAQITFTMNGQEYMYRAASTLTTDQEEAFKECEDLGGMYYEWSNIQDVEVQYRPARLLSTENGEGELVWLDVVPGINYVLTTTTNPESLVGVANAIFVCMQG